MVDETRDDVALAAEYAFTVYMVEYLIVGLAEYLKLGQPLDSRVLGHRSQMIHDR